MVVESVEEIVVTRDEASEVFDKLCRDRRPNGKPWNQRQLAKSLGVDQSTVSRNQKYMKAGKGISDDLYTKINQILRERKLEQLRQKQQEDQLEAERVAEAERQAEKEAEQGRLEAQRSADEAKERQQKLDQKAERARRAGVHSKLEAYWDDMRAQGMFKGVDPATQGDAPELLAKAQPSDINYPTLDLAMIALLPDDYRFECGLTAAQLRKGRTAWHRLRGKYPKRTDKSELVPPVLRPDADLHYAEDYRDILTWQRMNAEHSALALAPLPLVLSPETAKAFLAFVVLDRSLFEEGYSFMDSCLLECDDVEKRLQEVNRSTILPIAGSGALEGLKWMGIVAGAIAAIAAAAAIVFFVGWGAWELGNWVGDMVVAGVKMVFNWVVQMKWHIGGVMVLGTVLGLALWWAWPKASDQRNYPGVDAAGWRFFTVGAIMVFIVVFAIIMASTAAHIEANQKSIESFGRTVSDGIYNPKIIAP